MGAPRRGKKQEESNSIVDVLAGRHRDRRRAAILLLALLSLFSGVVAALPNLLTVWDRLFPTNGQSELLSLDTLESYPGTCVDETDSWWKDHQWVPIQNAPPTNQPMYVLHGWNESVVGLKNGPLIAKPGVLLLHPLSPTAPAEIAYVPSSPMPRQLLIGQVTGSPAGDVVLSIRKNGDRLITALVSGGPWYRVTVLVPPLSPGDSLILEARAGGNTPEAQYYFEQSFIDHLCFAAPPPPPWRPILWILSGLAVIAAMWVTLFGFRRRRAAA